MAASVYATPPPDHLSGDETALSDVSNSSQLSTPSNSMNTLKRSLSAASLLSTVAPATDSNNTSNATIPFTGNINIALPSDIANTLDGLATSNGNNDCINVSNLSSMLLDSMPDNSKKRRKQSTPIRISETAKANLALGGGVAIHPKTESEAVNESDKMSKTDDLTENDVIESDERKSPMPRIYLSNLSQLQEKQTESQKYLDHSEQFKKAHENSELLKAFAANNLNCDRCGLKLQSEIQLGLHILQEHGSKNSAKMDDQKTAEDSIPKIFVKKELSGTPTASNNWNDDEKEKPTNNQSSNGTMKSEDWMSSLPNFPFGFPPEAAVMLSASGYLPQMSMLGVNPFGGAADGLPRSSAPPLRIFNPEAYCDLCNKEFCNKYFLKTHKANKHNIYESATSASDSPSTSQMNPMTQFFHMQQQQLAAAHSQQMVSPNSSPQQQQSAPQRQSSPADLGQIGNSSSQENPILCDICFKRFSNTIAMRRHRNKVHENPGGNDLSNDKQTSTPPDAFREDFSIEQEDTTFTPQPRKLSPQSIQQAREANFSYDKLKRLGVINPEAFCEICCKEYCNKYFLRTHKHKRHNILMPMDDTILKDERAMVNAAAAAASAWQLMQNAPLNLIMNNAEALSQLHSHVRKKWEAGEIRKLSVDSIEDELEQPSKRQKPNEIENKSIGENDDAEEADNKSTDNLADGENIDLQKLQSMIMQLNDLSAQQRPVICGICGKGLENQFHLHSHMLAEHSNIGDNNNGHKVSPCSSPVTVNHTSEMCKHCEKEFPNPIALTQHLLETHGIPSTSPVRDGFVTPERPISGICLPTQAPNAPPIDRRSYTITPTSSYCEICNKELCNKYFMKTHMQRMHGIEIENGAQIGGVVCNICNKELCSKYFLRVHKQNTHGIIEDGSPLPQSRSNGDQIDADSIYSIDSSPKSGENNQNDLQNRYFSHFTEVCPLCNRRFRGSKWLRAHLLADHGKLGSDKLREIEQQLASMPKSSTSPTLKIPNNGQFGGGLNQMDPNFMQKQALTSLFGGVDDAVMATAGTKTKEYQCSYCSFSTPSYAFLYMHKRSLHANLLAEGMPGPNMNGPSISDKNESAISPAEISLPTASEINSNKNTPVSTPATTPVPVLISASNLESIPNDSVGGSGGVGGKVLTSIQKDSQLNDADTPIRSLLVQNMKTEIEQQNCDQQDAQRILAEMSNITKRPTTYAIPQELSNGMFMQSFFMEPVIDTNSDDANGDSAGNKSKTRFVPSVVFLPVRERIAGKTTISFSLTPA